jgi:pheromone shutdown-related protein TraB
MNSEESNNNSDNINNNSNNSNSDNINSNNQSYTINYSYTESSDRSSRPISDDPVENIIIVGTAHVSDKSVTEVDQTIEREQPDAVAVELCPARYQALTQQVEDKKISPEDILKGSKPYYILVHWMLAYVQKKIGDNLGVDPGAEMLQAIKKAESIDARIVLVDRDIKITLQRFWHAMSIKEKIKMFWALLVSVIGFKGDEIDIDTVTNEDVVTQLISELRKFAPSAARVFVDERDAYIAANLLKAGKSGRVVAVVGAGHREGIKRYFEHPETIPPLEELETVPVKRFNIMKILGIAFVALAFSTFLLVIIATLKGVLSPYMLLIAILYWVIINGVLSALGAAIARGHPKSILTAFCVAWLTSLNPFLAAGWFAGLVEAKYRKPTTGDFKRLIETESINEMFNIPLFRVLLVAALTNLGSVVGTFLGIYVILSLLGFNLVDVLQNLFAKIF